jgi:inorganic pyrophosphatase
MEISKDREHNPIVQDIKNGAPRYYDGPIYWNYGCFPRTWCSILTFRIIYKLIHNE